MRRTHDEALTSDLAGLIGFLRVKPYRAIAQQAEQAVRGSAEHFVATLAEHLLFEEERLFPALRRAAPGKAGAIDRLSEEHQLLRVYARELACRIAGGDDAGAYGVSRSFLVALLDHVERETKLTESILEDLDPQAQEGLKRILEGAPAPAGLDDAKGPDLLDPPCGT
jgi:hemerythrin-like domain-containing protein